MEAQTIRAQGKLTAVVIRKNGSLEFLGELRPTIFQRVRQFLKTHGLGFFCFLLLVCLSGLFFIPGLVFGLVTNAGVNYMASDFASGLASPRIGGFQYQDCGTGTTAAAVTDSALQTPAGTARVAGAASNPSANVYKSVATISFTSSLAITEWGLFSASTVGTMWDHRVFAAVNVNNGDSIQFTYQLTIPSGGT